MKKLLKYLFVGIAALFVIGALVGGKGEPEAAATGKHNKPAVAQAKQQATDSKAAVNKSVKINGLNIAVNDLEVKEDKILVGLTIKNNSTSKLTFFPDQGSVVVDSMQLKANMFLTDGDTSGDIHPGVEKTGTVTFLAPEGKSLDPKQISQVQLHLGDIFNDSTFQAQKADITLTLK